MLKDHIRWSDETNETKARNLRIQYWYSLAMESIKEKEVKFLGEPINITNPKEVIALLYVLYKDYEQFHERF